MFDNKIDWVTYLECCPAAVRRLNAANDPKTFTYKAEHEPESQQDRDRGEVFKL